MNRIKITASDQTVFSARVASPPSARATIHILHGMAEHCDRYQPLADYLLQHGFQVILHNHRGHGERTPAGHFGDSHPDQPCGWDLVLSDIQCVHNALCGSEPYILFGHSMGSFIAQAFAIRYRNEPDALILSGSNHQPGAMVQAGLLTARLLRLLQGQRHRSAIMDRLSFGEFNRPFRPARTAFDWLSRDEAMVDAYIADPLCGQPCSLQLWIDLLSGLKEIGRAENLAEIPAAMPCYLFGGDHDPVGRMGKGLPELQRCFATTGHNDVTMKLYTDGRHEMLNEINRADVFNDLLTWLDRHF
ncbi:MAG: alpha/beta hydrolase [Pseudomonadota bacterium]|nr:alpha/beta hydrolase [Pseudomonadota bacterium]